MTILVEHTLTSLSDLEIRAAHADVVTWQGREALRLEDGLALIPGLQTTDASIEVLIGTEGPAYPGVAFRAADILNFGHRFIQPGNDQRSVYTFSAIMLQTERKRAKK